MKLQTQMFLFAAVLALGVLAGFVDPVTAQWAGFVGAVVAVKSTVITNADAVPVVFNSAILDKGSDHNSIAIANIANGDSIGSTYRMFRVRSGDRVQDLVLRTQAITTAAADIGLYDTAANGGAVVSSAFWAAAQTLAAANNFIDVRFQSGANGGLLTNAEKRIWEALGLAADPRKEYDVVLTLTAAATAAGAAVLQVGFVSSN